MPRTPSLICNKCSGPRTLSGTRYICVSCNRARSTAYQKANPEKVNARHRAWKKLEVHPGWTKARAYKLWQKYRMTPEEFELIKTAQKNCCAICELPTDLLVVDHDHKTSENRALLCKQCNFGLGSFQDNPDWLRAAADYLETHS